MPSSSVQPILALLADPIHANPLQYMIEKAFAHHDLEWRYLSLEVAPEQLGDAVRGLRAMGFRGGNVATPHKEAVVPLLDRASETAGLVGAANLILREGECLVGENTEGRGLVEALRHLIDVPGKRYLVLGAGRAARAVALELAAAGAAGIVVANRTPARAEELAALVAGKYPIPATTLDWQGDCQIPLEVEVVVHATSVGDDDARVAVAAETLRPELLVADMTTTPPETPLLRDAAGRGCRTLDGLTIFIEQVALDLRLWTGADPDRQILRDAIEEFLDI